MARSVSPMSEASLMICRTRSSGHRSMTAQHCIVTVVIPSLSDATISSTTLLALIIIPIHHRPPTTPYLALSSNVRHDIPGACSTAHRSNRPGRWDGLMLDRSAVVQLSSLSSVLLDNDESSKSRTQRQRLPAGDRPTLRNVSPAGNRCHF